MLLLNLILNRSDFFNTHRRLHSLTSGGSIHLQYEHFHEGDAAGESPRHC